MDTSGRLHRLEGPGAGPPANGMVKAEKEKGQAEVVQVAAQQKQTTENEQEQAGVMDENPGLSLPM